MIQVGAAAPRFSLQDQFGRTFASESQRARHHSLLCFYPLDFTPT